MGYAETATLGGTAPRQFELFADLPDAVIRAAVDAVTRADHAVEVRHWGGAMARAPAPARSATATSPSRSPSTAPPRPRRRSRGTPPAARS